MTQLHPEKQTTEPILKTALLKKTPSYNWLNGKALLIGE